MSRTRCFEPLLFVQLFGETTAPSGLDAVFGYSRLTRFIGASPSSVGLSAKSYKPTFSLKLNQSRLIAGTFWQVWFIDAFNAGELLAVAQVNQRHALR